MISARLASDVARQAGNASAAAWTAAIDLVDAREVDLVGLLARRRVEHGSGATGLPQDDLAADVSARSAPCLTPAIARGTSVEALRPPW